MTAEQISRRLEPFVGAQPVPADLYEKLAVYLDLLLKWNARTNLTAIRQEAEIIERHFGESVFLALELRRRLPADADLLDFGSGAGFPGIPVHLMEPGWKVTLAESQGKKAAFLREAVRTLGLATEVWGQRVESMPKERGFDAVMLRAVDKMPEALEAARKRVRPIGILAVLGSEGADGIPVPGSDRRRIFLT